MNADDSCGYPSSHYREDFDVECWTKQRYLEELEAAQKAVIVCGDDSSQATTKMTNNFFKSLGTSK